MTSDIPKLEEIFQFEDIEAFIQFLNEEFEIIKNFKALNFNLEEDNSSESNLRYNTMLKSPKEYM